jgi:parallel beta-helix repeat protein
MIDALESRRLLAIYYVATNGSDANAGSAGAPFASIRQAAFFTKPGDTVLVRGGTYKPGAQVWIGQSGTKSQRITYKPYKNEKVTIDGSNMPANTDLMSIGGDYVTVQGFTLANSKQIGVVILEADGVTLSGNRITGARWQGVAGWGSSPNAYKDLTVQNNQIDNNTFGFFDDARGQYAQGIAIQKCASVTVRGNTVFNNWGEGILLSQNGEGSVIENNTVHDNFGINIYLMDQNGAVVRNNFCYSTGDTRFYRYNQPARAVQVANETWGAPKGGNRNQIVNNLSVGCSYGFYYGNYFVGGGLHDTTIANNTWVNSTQATLWLDTDTHSNTRIFNNIAWQSVKSDFVRFPNQAGFSWSSNLWYGGGTLNAAFTSKTDVNANPRFVKYGSLNPLDYRLQSKSPVLNRSAVVVSNTDFLSTARKKGKAVDLGAFELK